MVQNANPRGLAQSQSGKPAARQSRRLTSSGKAVTREGPFVVAMLMRREFLVHYASEVPGSKR